MESVVGSLVIDGKCGGELCSVDGECGGELCSC